MYSNELFYQVASHFIKIIEKADRLYKIGGDELTEGIELFASKLPILHKIQDYSANYAVNDITAAKICIDFALDAVLCLSHISDIETQIKWHSDALNAARMIDDAKLIYRTANNLAITLTIANKGEEAIILLQECLKILEKLDNISDKARILNSLGVAHEKIGKYDEAINFYKKKLVLAKSIPDERLEASAYGNLGIAYMEKGNYTESIKYHKLRLRIANKIKNARIISNAFGDLGITFRKMGNLDKSRFYLKKQLSFSKAHSMRDGEGSALWELSLTLQGRGDIQEAIVNAKEAYQIYNERSNPLAVDIQIAIRDWKRQL